MRVKLAALAGVLERVESDDTAEDLADVFRATRKAGNRLYFIGNGGSAAIASHMAIDWLNKAKMRAMCFNDGAALTCLSNDYGYDEVFEIPLSVHAALGDVLVAISSSGQSENILRAVKLVRHIAVVITLSGFAPDNPLRGLGHTNFYVPSSDYGIVETAHLGILHALLDKVAS